MSKTERPLTEPKKILVCQQRQIGDVLLATPVFRLLRGRFPDAELHMFTEKKCEPLLRHNPCVDAFHLIEKGGFFRQVAFYRKTAAQGFDAVIDLQQLPRCRTMTLFSRAPVRVSFFSRPFIHWRYTHLVRPEQGYACRTKASLLKPFGISWHGEGPEIFLLEEEKAAGRQLLKDCGWQPELQLVTIDSTHRRASKRWPAERFAELILRLGRNGGRQFLLLRGPGEESEMQNLQALCLGLGVKKEHLLLPAEVPGIRLSAACIAEADLHVGGCSAPRHMAAALGVPSLVIPGASGPEWRFPLPMHRELRPELPCQPCSLRECPDPKCLLLITPEMAADQAEEMLRAWPKHARAGRLYD